MILLVLICTLIGYLCGSALIGLGAGVLLALLGMWATSDPLPRARARRRTRDRKYR